MFVASVTTNMSQRINELLVHLPPGSYELTVRTAQGEKLALADGTATIEAGEVTVVDLASQPRASG